MLAARENRMLNAERMERMLDAPTDDEAAKTLEECGYGDLSGMSAKEVNAALEEHIAAVFTEVEGMVPEPELVQMFRLKYDFHNVKTLIKAQAAGTDGTALLSGRANVQPGVLQTAFVSGEYQDVPPELAETMQDAAGILARTSNPQLADFALDRAYFEQLRALAGAVNDGGFAANYVRLQIDSANLRAVVRTHRMGKDVDFLRLALVPGGEIDPDRLLAAADSSESLQGLYHMTWLSAAADAGAAAMNGGGLTAFELLCDNALVDYVREAKRMRFGAAHVVAYLAAMENETTAARMILTGRLSGLAPDVIRERLRETYA